MFRVGQRCVHVRHVFIVHTCVLVQVHLPAKECTRTPSKLYAVSVETFLLEMLCTPRGCHIPYSHFCPAVITPAKEGWLVQHCSNFTHLLPAVMQTVSCWH